jgi:GNAT superfamily N-acetyltransferase
MATVAIERLTRLPPNLLAELLTASEQEGFRFVRRLVAGDNRFDRPGEALFAASAGGRVIGVCGLSYDPFAGSPDVGRVRRLYVLPEYRQQGVGRRLVDEVVSAARGHFRRLRLRTNADGADQFYRALGFERSTELDCTHVLELGALPIFVDTVNSSSRGEVVALLPDELVHEYHSAVTDRWATGLDWSVPPRPTDQPLSGCRGRREGVPRWRRTWRPVLRGHLAPGQ